MTDSISRKFARWAADLQFGDLPSQVVDKTKAFIVFELVAGVFGAPLARAQEMVALVKAEEAKPDGATILIDGTKATRFGAVSANCQILKCAALFDSYRMLTHPGAPLVAVALTNAELAHKNMGELITGLAAGYEFQCRLSYDFAPSVSGHGFDAAVFTTMGSAMVAGKLLDLNEDDFVATIALAANSASGLQVSSFARGGERAISPPNAARQGTYAAVVAAMGKTKGSEQAIEGEAGFFSSYAGSHDGNLSYVFTGPKKIDLASITDSLGEKYRLMEVMFRMYPAPGFNQPVINLISELKQQHRFSADDVVELTIYMNRFETLFPRFELPRDTQPDTRDRHVQLFWSIQFFAADAAVHGGYPVVGGAPFDAKAGEPQSDEAVLAFMGDKVRVVGVYDHPMFSPAVTVKMKDGTSYFGNYPYERLAWGFEQIVEQLQGCVPGLPGGQSRLDAIVETVRNIDQTSTVEPLFEAVGTQMS